MKAFIINILKNRFLFEFTFLVVQFLFYQCIDLTFNHNL